MRLKKNGHSALAGMLAMLGVTQTVHADACVEVIVPGYFYPTWYTPDTFLWPTAADDTLLQLGNDRNRMLVMNPANGPGATVNSDYVVAHDAATGSDPEGTDGIHLLGYVATGYGAVPRETVLAEMLQYHTLYGHFDGMFLDEVSTDPAFVENYYKWIVREYTRKPHRGNDVVLNQGVLPVGSEYMSIQPRGNGTAYIIGFEGSQASYITSYIDRSWVQNYPASRFMHIVYDTKKADMETTVDLAVTRHAEWVYVTPDVLPNPWDTLSGVNSISTPPATAYWDDLTAYAESDCN